MPDKILRQIPHTTKLVLALNINTVSMPHKLMCVSDVCFFYFETKGVKAGKMISDSWEKIPRPGRARGK